MKDYAVLDSFKDRMDSTIDDAFEEGYKQGYEDGKQVVLCDCKENMDNEYNRGLNDAWDAAKKLCRSVKYGGIEEHCSEIFEKTPFETFDVFDYIASEAIAKIKEYEDKQKQDAEIKVGDEVYSDAFDDKGIVTHITTDKVSCVCIICNGFTMMKVGLCGLHKTGRHFDQIAEVLAKLRGAENDE